MHHRAPLLRDQRDDTRFRITLFQHFGSLRFEFSFLLAKLFHPLVLRRLPLLFAFWLFAFLLSELREECGKEECTEFRRKIRARTGGDYFTAKLLSEEGREGLVRCIDSEWYCGFVTRIGVTTLVGKGSFMGRVQGLRESGALGGKSTAAVTAISSLVLPTL